MQNQLKVLFITSWYPHASNPMHGIFVREHARAVQLFDEIRILHILESQDVLKPSWQLNIDNDFSVTAGLLTYRLRISRSPYRSLTFLYYLWRTMQAFRQLYSTGYRPDILHAHTFRAGFVSVVIGKLYHLPVVISEHNSAFPRRLLTTSKIILSRLAFQNAERVLVPSKYLQKSIESYGIRGRFEVCPNVVDTDIFYPPDKCDVAITNKQLLSIGHLEPNKGLDVLIKALASLFVSRQDWHLIVIGAGSNRTQYELLVDELGLHDNVSFYGYQSKSKIANIMRDSDLFILSSHVETFSLAAAEALACGLPVLSTRCGGPEEFITPEVGRLVPANDPISMGTELLSMLGQLDRYVRENISAYASTYFSPRKVGTNLHNLYSQLVE